MKEAKILEEINKGYTILFTGTIEGPFTKITTYFMSSGNNYTIKSKPKTISIPYQVPWSCFI